MVQANPECPLLYRVMMQIQPKSQAGVGSDSREGAAIWLGMRMRWVTLEATGISSNKKARSIERAS